MAIKCYTEAIDLCPKSNKSDLSTFYQNRAAAYEQMVRFYSKITYKHSLGLKILSISKLCWFIFDISQEKSESVLSDCNEALKLNDRYVKALERRARVQRKAATTTSSNLKKKLETMQGNSASEECSVTKTVVDQLRMALEDMTAVCILEGFQKQEHLMLVDTILKELGM